MFEVGAGMSEALLGALAKAIGQLIAAIDLTDDDEVDPDLASRWFEDVAATFSYRRIAGSWQG